MLAPTLLAIVATIYLIVRVVLTVRARDAPSRGSVEVRATPPAELTPATAARLLRDVDDRLGITAEMLDLAVKGAWRLGVRDVEGTPTWVLHRPHPYEPALGGPPQALYRGVFAPGDMTLSRALVANPERSGAYADALAAAGLQVVTRGWVRRHQQPYLVLNLLGQALLAGSLIIPATAAWLSHGTLVDPEGPEGLPLIIYAGSIGFGAQFFGIRRWTLTPEGRRLTDELAGLRRYMTMTDDERRAVVGLTRVEDHENLLPYAVLFGIVPDWLEVLGRDHERAGTTPTWVQGGGQDPAALASVCGSLAGVGGLRRLGT